MGSVSERNDGLEKPSVVRIETKTGRKLRLSAEAKASYARANQLDRLDWELGTVVVKATKNNTFLTFHNRRGEVVYRVSAGQLNFQGSKRGSLFAAQAVGEAFGEWLLSDQGRIHALRFSRSVFYKFRGDGQGGFGALRGLRTRGVDVLERKDATPCAHGGVRPRKVRRV